MAANMIKFWHQERMQLQYEYNEFDNWYLLQGTTFG